MPETRRNCRHVSKPKLARKDLQGGGVGGESRPSSTHLGIMHGEVMEKMEASFWGGS